MDIKLGDLILVRGTGPISRAIEEITDSPYSHAAGLVGENELIEANGFRRIGYEALHEYADVGDVFTCDTLTDEQRRKIVDYVKREVGGHYDWSLLFVELIRYALHIILPYREPASARICSTLWADAYRAVGVDLCPGVKYPSPADLAKSPLLRKVGGIG